MQTGRLSYSHTDGAAGGAAGGAADGAECVYVVIPGSKNSAMEEEAVDGTAITGEA